MKERDLMLIEIKNNIKLVSEKLNKNSYTAFNDFYEYVDLNMNNPIFIQPLPFGCPSRLQFMCSYIDLPMLEEILILSRKFKTNIGGI